MAVCLGYLILHVGGTHQFSLATKKCMAYIKMWENELPNSKHLAIQQDLLDLVVVGSFEHKLCMSLYMPVYYRTQISSGNSPLKSKKISQNIQFSIRKNKASPFHPQNQINFHKI